MDQELSQETYRSKMAERQIGITRCPLLQFCQNHASSKATRTLVSILHLAAIMENSSILEKFDFYIKAPGSFQIEMEKAVKPATLEEGSFFYLEGDYCPQVALIGSGNIRVFKISEKGRQITLYHLREGETCLVNMLCAFTNQPSPAAAQAESAVSALLIPANIFREWIRTTDVIRNHVFERMSSRIVEVMMLVEEVAFRKMDQRIASFLIQHSKYEGTSRFLVITHEEIATELGTAREVVSRVLKEFERMGAIGTGRNRIEILDFHILDDLSGNFSSLR